MVQQKIQKGDFVIAKGRESIVIGDAIDEHKFKQWMESYYAGKHPPFSENEAKKKIGFHVQDTLTGEVFVALSSEVEPRRQDFVRGEK